MIKRIFRIVCMVAIIGLMTTGCMARETANDYAQAIVSGVISGVFTVLGVLVTLFAGRKTFLRQMGIQNTPLLTAYLKSGEERTHQLSLDITDGDEEPTPTQIRAESLSVGTNNTMTLCFKNDGNGTAKDIEYGSVQIEPAEHLLGRREQSKVYRRTSHKQIETLHGHPYHLVKSDVLELTITFDNGNDFSRLVMVHFKDIIGNRHLQKVLVEKHDKSIYLYPISRDYYR